MPDLSVRINFYLRKISNDQTSNTILNDSCSTWIATDYHKVPKLEILYM